MLHFNAGISVSNLIAPGIPAIFEILTRRCTIAYSPASPVPIIALVMAPTGLVKFIDWFIRIVSQPTVASIADHAEQKTSV